MNQLNRYIQHPARMRVNASPASRVPNTEDSSLMATGSIKKVVVRRGQLAPGVNDVIFSGASRKSSLVCDDGKRRKGLRSARSQSIRWSGGAVGAGDNDSTPLAGTRGLVERNIDIGGEA